MSALTFLEDSLSFVTPIPDTFIREHMPSANGVYVKVYLSVFHAYYHRLSDFSFDRIARELNILESEVLEALRHWNARGALRLSYNKVEDTYRISFSSAPEDTPSPEDPKPTRKKAAKTNVIRVEQPPIYSPEEMSLYSQNEEISALFHEVSHILGTVLSQSHCCKIFSFYDYYRLPIDVIIYLVRYCTEHDHRDLRYIEKVAMNWSDNEIHSVEDAEKYVHRFDVYMPVLKAMHASSMIPTDEQSRLIDKWLLEYGMGMDVLVEAAERTYERTHKAQFSYMRSIIEHWHENGVKTMQDVFADDQTFASKGASQASLRASGATKGYKDNKYIPSNHYDYDAILAENRRLLNDQYEQIKEN